MNNDLLAKLRAVVDARIVVIDAGECMEVLRTLDEGGCEFLNTAGEWVAEPCELVRLIAVVPTKEKPRARTLTEFAAAMLGTLSDDCG